MGCISSQKTMKLEYLQTKEQKNNQKQRQVSQTNNNKISDKLHEPSLIVKKENSYKQDQSRPFQNKRQILKDIPLNLSNRPAWNLNNPETNKLHHHIDQSLVQIIYSSERREDINPRRQIKENLQVSHEKRFKDHPLIKQDQIIPVVQEVPVNQSPQTIMKKLFDDKSNYEQQQTHQKKLQSEIYNEPMIEQFRFHSQRKQQNPHPNNQLSQINESLSESQKTEKIEFGLQQINQINFKMTLIKLQII